MSTQVEIPWDICSVKHGGNPESAAAFAKIEQHLSKQQAEVFDFIALSGSLGMTTTELAIVMGSREHPKPKNEFSGRVSDLLRLGKIERKQIGVEQDGSPIWHRRLGCAVFYAKGEQQ